MDQLPSHIAAGFVNDTNHHHSYTCGILGHTGAQWLGMCIYKHMLAKSPLFPYVYLHFTLTHDFNVGIIYRAFNMVIPASKTRLYALRCQL
jgi:hypothetical protein